MKDITLTESNGLLFVSLNTKKAKQEIGCGNFSVNLRDKQWIINRLKETTLTIKYPINKAEFKPMYIVGITNL